MPSSPKEKIERRLGTKLFLKGERCIGPKCAVVRNPTPPGVHGRSHRRAPSEYGEQLAEKQRIKFTYGLDEKQLKNYFKTKTAGGNLDKKVLERLESRLDNAVYRSGFAVSRSIARFLVSHGHILVNDKKNNMPAYEIKPGDIIKLNADKLTAMSNDIKSSLKKYKAPDWIELDKEKISARIASVPKIDVKEMPFNIKSAIEFYSR